MNKKLKIAIDGPAASGKSTTAKMVAKKLGYLYIDSGAMYRALTLAVLRYGVDIHDEKAIVAIIRRVNIDYKNKRTFLEGEDVSSEIRLPKITKVISIISAYPGVRKIMVDKQRKLAKKGRVVMDGRDIGTVVLSDAEVKIFLKASIQERAKRRYIELEKKGVKVNLQEIKRELIERDKIDSSRDVAPLKPANDAYIVDNSDMTIHEQVEEVLKIIGQFNKNK
jgi:cytidylate kinase